MQNVFDMAANEVGIREERRKRNMTSLAHMFPSSAEY